MAAPKISAFKAIVLFAIIVAVVIRTSNCDAAQRRCGRLLADTLKVVCKNKYNAFGKKSVIVDDYYNDDQYDDETPYPYADLPFLKKLKGNPIMPHVRRLREGVSDECCKKPCSLDELRSYCNNQYA